MNAEIISVGTELLLGDIVNTNAAFLAKELASLGYGVYYQTVVGDNPTRLAAVVKQAKNRSDLLVLTGGLGPTDDDLTKQTVAEVFGDTLEIDQEELAKIEGWFAKRGAVMTENNKKQALVPRNGYKLPNENGTAPGIVFVKKECKAFLLPGPPNEMVPMFLQQVKPILEEKQNQTIHSITLHIVGIGESALETQIKELLQSENPTAALYAKTGEVHLRITARADTQKEALEMCEEKAKVFRKELKNYIYSENDDNLETTVVKILEQQRQTVATAESCTGGLLSQRITSVPGASNVFGFGVCTYSNQMKQRILGVKEETLEEFGAVSGQVAEQMANGALSFANAAFGVGITGLAGPGGETQMKPVGLVYIAVCSKQKTVVKKIILANRARQTVREMAVQTALNMLRQIILEIPIDEIEWQKTTI